MKRVNNIYNQITDLKVIKVMYDNRIRINTKNKVKLEKDNNVKLPRYKNGKGLPIGNMSSQILAIIYLNELDH